MDAAVLEPLRFLEEVRHASLLEPVLRSGDEQVGCCRLHH